ncbi:MAG: NAD(P)-binding domain-containing protein [Candidatus Eremiobacteraeota bacterium]|nr:NAD(P)-binding domain-containing protein [Candidatus Eremiobacteraeota bacterium]
MKIGILGSGDVAKSFAIAFLAHGDDVMLGTRDVKKLAEWQGEHANAKVGTFAETASFGEIVVLATLGTATVEAIGLAGTEAFDGKVVIDATNPLRFDQSGPHLAISGDDSAGERVQAAIPNAHVVKAFNTVGNELFYQPKLKGGPPTMFVAGNDDGAKAKVAGILHDFGWESADIGGIESSRYLEAMCLAWVWYAIKGDHRAHAFKMLR